MELTRSRSLRTDDRHTEFSALRYGAAYRHICGMIEENQTGTKRQKRDLRKLLRAIAKEGGCVRTTSLYLITHF